MRTAVVGGNWKMNLDLAGAEALARDLRGRLGSFRAAETIVFPSHPFLVPVGRIVGGSGIALGAQDVHPEKGGAYTGGVAAVMLRSVGCTHVLVGHSERRAWFGDDDKRVGQKLSAALGEGLVPVLCIGETLAERRADRTFDVLRRQIDSALAGRKASDLASLIVAYEPVWAIGTGETASPAQAQEVHLRVRAFVGTHFGPDFAARLRIQYGGSVKASNAASLMAQPDIDGALVGGASLKAADFVPICTAAARRP